MACGSCGGRRARAEAARQHVDPTRAVFAAQRTRYLVLANAAARTGKRFTTLVDAEAYARQTGGIVRPVPE